MYAIFKMDMEDLKNADEIFKPFQNLFQAKQNEVLKFYKELIDIDVDFDCPFAEDRSTKFLFQSMCMSLDDINLLYDFFKQSIDEFSTS